MNDETKLVSADEARAIEARARGVFHEHYRCTSTEEYEASAILATEIPSLTATVISVTAQRDMARVETERDRVVMERVDRAAATVAVMRQRDGAYECADRLRGDIDELRAEMEATWATAETYRRERDALRAIIEGRTTAPTLYEADAHAAAMGAWLAWFRGDSGRHRLAVGYGDESDAWRINNLVARWWALDANGRPCAWPVVAGGPDAAR